VRSRVVVAHPSRRTGLAERLGWDEIEDPDPDGPREGGPWRVLRRALLEAPRGDLLVVQDDAVPCPRFDEHLEALAPLARDAVLVLYLGAWDSTLAIRVSLACAVGEAFLPLDPHRPFIHTVATSYPAHHRRPLAESHTPPPHLADDNVVARYCALTGTPVLATTPSLCDHDGRARSVANPGKLLDVRTAIRVADEHLEPSHWSQRA
jgi:hypothetical protein